MEFLRHPAFYRLFLPSVALLRKRHFAFLVLAGRAIGESDCGESVTREGGMSQEKSGQGFRKVEAPDGLLLYYDRFSYYSQKVVMALHEKNLPFESRIVNLIKNEQYEPWFLHLNSKGEVPVLHDTVRIIPDSARIIDYLEDNFSNGDTPRLIPMVQGPEVRQRVNHFRHILQKVPAGQLTTGAMLHPNLLQNPKVPFLAPIRKALVNAEKNGGEKLREVAEKNPESRDVLLQKATNRDAAYQSMLVESNFKNLLNEVDQVLTQIEEELSKHTDGKQDWWLCSDLFTIADVELTILLVRISQLGLEHHFWTDGKRPHIEQYYARVQKRDSFKKTIPGTLYLLKTLLISQAPIVIGIVAAVALVIGGALIAKRFIP